MFLISFIFDFLKCCTAVVTTTISSQKSINTSNAQALLSETTGAHFMIAGMSGIQVILVAGGVLIVLVGCILISLAVREFTICKKNNGMSIYCSRASSNEIQMVNAVVNVLKGEHTGNIN